MRMQSFGTPELQISGLCNRAEYCVPTSTLRILWGPSNVPLHLPSALSRFEYSNCTRQRTSLTLVELAIPSFSSSIRSLNVNREKYSTSIRVWEPLKA